MASGGLIAAAAVAGWSVVLALLVLELTRLPERNLPRGRRRISINRAMHELRRPIQLLCLHVEGGVHQEVKGDVALIRQALSDLDEAVNPGAGREGVDSTAMRRAPQCQSVSLDVVLVAEELSRRWRPLLAGEGRELKLRRPVARVGATIEGTAHRLAQLLDNLCANCLEHGEGPVWIGVAPGREDARITIANGRPAVPVLVPGSAGELAARRDPRRGHGLEVATELATDLGAVLELSPGEKRFEAVLKLPASGLRSVPVDPAPSAVHGLGDRQATAAGQELAAA